MKKLLLLALLITMMVGCNNDALNHVYGTGEQIIDSCEYITGYNRLTHKGNCRFCTERNKRMIREQVDSILTDIFD